MDLNWVCTSNAMIGTYYVLKFGHVRHRAWSCSSARKRRMRLFLCRGVLICMFGISQLLLLVLLLFFWVQMSEMVIMYQSPKQFWPYVWVRPTIHLGWVSFNTIVGLRRNTTYFYLELVTPPLPPPPLGWASGQLDLLLVHTYWVGVRLAGSCVQHEPVIPVKKCHAQCMWLTEQHVGQHSMLLRWGAVGHKQRTGTIVTGQAPWGIHNSIATYRNR